MVPRTPEPNPPDTLFPCTPLYRSLASGAMVAVGTALLVDYSYFDATLIAGFAAAMALLFALLGIIVGLWAERWDHYGAVEGFVIVPLGLLSGTFFSVARLPEGFRDWIRSEEHTSELQSLMRISYAGFCLKNKNP